MNAPVCLPSSLRPRLESELLPDESVLWAGQPSPYKGVPISFALWLFFVPWTFISLALGAPALETLRRDASWTAIGGALFVLPFIAIGLFGLLLPLLAVLSNRKTIYAVTDRRVLILEGLRSCKVRAFALSGLGRLERTQRRDGSGDLVVKVELYRDSDGDIQEKKHAFERVRDVRGLERLVESARIAAGAPDRFEAPAPTVPRG